MSPGARPSRDLPLAAPPADRHEPAPDPGGPRPTPRRAPRTAQRAERTPPTTLRHQRRRALLIGVLLLGWAAAILVGWGETVVLVEPVTIRGSLGTDGTDGDLAAARIVAAIATTLEECQTPALELRIGGGSLDRSLDAHLDYRLLPAARGERARYELAGGSAAWEAALPGLGGVLSGARRVGYFLTGRRVRTLSTVVLAADGRLSMQADLDRHALNYEQIQGRDWTRALPGLAGVLFLEVQPTLAATYFLRVGNLDAAGAAVAKLQENRDPSDDVTALAFAELLRQERAGTRLLPEKLFVPAYGGGPSWTAVPWQRMLRRATPGYARWKDGQVLAHTFAGYRALTAGRLGPAEEDLEYALRLQPRDPQASLLLAETWRQGRKAEKLQNTLDLLEGGLQPAPGARGRYLLLWQSLICEDLKLPGPAEELFAAALKARPEDQLLLNNRGVYWYFAHEKEKAWADFQSVLETRPRRVAALMNRGVMRAEGDKATEALVDFGWSIRFAPHQPATYLHSARAEFDAGRYANAAAILQAGHEALTEEPEFPLQYGYALAADGQFEAAANALRFLPERTFIEERWQLYQGHVAFLAGDFAVAEGFYEAAVDRQEASGSAGYALGQVAFNLADWPTAVTHFQSYAQRYPDNTRARLFLYLAERQVDPAIAAAQLHTLAEQESRPWLQQILALYRTDQWTPWSDEPGLSDEEIARRDCTRAFHEGMWHLGHGRSGEARSAFARSVATGLTHHYEYQASRRHLSTVR